MRFSKFSERFAEQAGIVQLMEDLGSAMSGESDVLMLGGGNPGQIPMVQEIFHQRLQHILDDPSHFARMIGNYGSPQGDTDFIQSLARFFNKEFGWNITADNIVLTSGSQSGFFYLFNMLGGEFEGEQYKKILLPMTPEYIGYADVGLSDDLFTANRPDIELLDDHFFKYHVNFNDLTVDKNIGALCVSRPTNPTGNVLTNEELRHLQEIADNNQIPLIIDNAYGLPFPNIVFTEATPLWSENTILCMSLSKLGLPGVRTGIIIAPPSLISAIRNINAVLSLALGSFGPALAQDIIDSGEIRQISDTLIQPFYREKAELALQCLHHEMDGLDYYIHKPEGAIFLWLWFPNLKITSEQLYQRLKERGVLVISGHHFFPGLKDDWPHKHQCIRVTYSMPGEVVQAGIKILADEVRKAC